MSLVLQYKFDQTDVSLDSSGSSLHATNVGVTSTVDATYGNVASFSETTFMRLDTPPSVITGSSPRTFSAWTNRTSVSSVDTIFDCGFSVSTRFILYLQGGVLRFIVGGVTVSDITGVHELDTWYHVVVTFNGTTVTVYRDGANIHSSNQTVNTQGPLYIGTFFSESDIGFDGEMSDFRLYDYSMDSSEVSTLYSNGPKAAIPSSLSIVPRSTNMPVTITEITGATGYYVTLEGSTGGEITFISNTTTLEHNITGLDPETQYTVRLYADTGTGYDLIEEEVITTLANVAANYDVTDFISDGIVDLKSLPDSTIANIGEVMNDLFTTGDLFSISVAEKPASFVKLGETISISNSNGVLFPFIQNAIPGQAATVTLSDGTTDVNITFDELGNTITVSGTVYSPGDIFILDGKKVTVVEY